ncbi:MULTISPECIES: YggT family protein [Parasaccharibacter]|nr:YggT family protein [Parasaccharibacter apium]
MWVCISSRHQEGYPPVHAAIIYLQVINLLMVVLDVYTWIILAYCLASMAIGFGVINPQTNRFVSSLLEILARLVEPVLQPIRNILPDTGMMDFSPLILLLAIQYGIPFILKSIFRIFFLPQG